jgi:hypothetical protein
MANSPYLDCLEDLLNEARINPNFNLAEELAALSAAMSADGVFA